MLCVCVRVIVVRVCACVSCRLWCVCVYLCACVWLWGCVCVFDCLCVFVCVIPCVFVCSVCLICFVWFACPCVCLSFLCVRVWLCKLLCLFVLVRVIAWRGAYFPGWLVRWCCYYVACFCCVPLLGCIRSMVCCGVRVYSCLCCCCLFSFVYVRGCARFACLSLSCLVCVLLVVCFVIVFDDCLCVDVVCCWFCVWCLF